MRNLCPVARLPICSDIAASTSSAYAVSMDVQSSLRRCPLRKQRWKKVSLLILITVFSSWPIRANLARPESRTPLRTFRVLPVAIVSSVLAHLRQASKDLESDGYGGRCLLSLLLSLQTLLCCPVFLLMSVKVKRFVSEQTSNNSPVVYPSGVRLTTLCLCATDLDWLHPAVGCTRHPVTHTAEASSNGV